MQSVRDLLSVGGRLLSGQKRTASVRAQSSRSVPLRPDALLAVMPGIEIVLGPKLMCPIGKVRWLSRSAGI